MAFTLTPEEKERWKAHRKATSRKATNLGKGTTFSRKKKVLADYLKHGSKSKVCNDHHMSKHTLNKILAAAGVV